MTELYLRNEDQQRADEFARHEMPIAPWLGQLSFYKDQWQLVQELAEQNEVVGLPKLVPAERSWLIKLGATVDTFFSFELSTILARTASHIIAVDGELTMSPDEAGAVVYARSAFLGKTLGWDEIGAAPLSLRRYYAARSQNHPAHVPLGSFITSQRLIYQADVSVSAVARQWGDILDIDSSRVQRVMQGGMVEGVRSYERAHSFIRAYAAQQ